MKCLNIQITPKNMNMGEKAGRPKRPKNSLPFTQKKKKKKKTSINKAKFSYKNKTGKHPWDKTRTVLKKDLC